MAEWIYMGEYKWQCSKCMQIIEHKREQKRCPNCNAEMKNAFNRMFPPNNWTPKKKK